MIMLSHGYQDKHIYKNKNKQSSYQLFFNTITSSNHRHYCLSLAQPNDINIIGARVPWTKLESAKYFIRPREDIIIWSHQINNEAYESHSSFHRGLLITKTQKKKKKFRETHWKYFWSFWFFFQKGKQIKGEKEKQKREKLFTRESSQQAKEEQGNLFGFSLKCN